MNNISEDFFKKKSFQNKLLEAAKNQIVSFRNLHNLSDIKLSLNDPSTDALKEINSRYNRFGFVIIDLDIEEINEKTVVDLAILLKLGDAYLPPLYQNEGHTRNPISKISQTYNNGRHPSFEDKNHIPFHTDGTLQSIGFVKTSILACNTQSYLGGESIFFNSTGAYAELLLSNFDSAVTLAFPDSLIRQANINDCIDKNIGPVFMEQNNLLVSAYSVTKTDRFQCKYPEFLVFFKKAISYFKKASEVGSPFVYEKRLNNKQVLILANHRISHGRKSFVNDQKNKRCMYRGLFLSEPRVI